ncbi:hypothetical protein B0G69_1361 [Paraburkholderia sp. RAU2J]|nr:hypothetical protein B0G69_1361 [Paraburkholderia sp. RAU2J]
MRRSSNKASAPKGQRTADDNMPAWLRAFEPTGAALACARRGARSCGRRTYRVCRACVGRSVLAIGESICLSALRKSPYGTAIAPLQPGRAKSALQMPYLSAGFQPADRHAARRPASPGEVAAPHSPARTANFHRIRRGPSRCGRGAVACGLWPHDGQIGQLHRTGQRGQALAKLHGENLGSRGNEDSRQRPQTYPHPPLDNFCRNPLAPCGRNFDKPAG